MFFEDGGWATTKFRETLRSRGPYVLVRLSYRPSRSPGFVGSKESVAAGFSDESWELRVGPTLPGTRSLARRLLLADGLPALASWLRRAHGLAADERFRCIELVFDPARETLAAREHIGAQDHGPARPAIPTTLTLRSAAWRRGT